MPPILPWCRTDEGGDVRKGVSLGLASTLASWELGYPICSQIFKTVICLGQPGLQVGIISHAFKEGRVRKYKASLHHIGILRVEYYRTCLNMTGVSYSKIEASFAGWMRGEVL